MTNNFLEKEVAEFLLSLKITISVAESLTGGLICHRLTNISGSSDYLDMGIVTYSNRSKIEILGVPEEIIKQHGAVSEACVRAMAMGVRQLAGTDLGLAVSGIAGPTGGSPNKPVGTVHVALAWNMGEDCRKFFFKGDRGRIKEQSSTEALVMISKYRKWYG